MGTEEICDCVDNLEILQLGRFCAALRNHDDKERMVRRDENQYIVDRSPRARATSDSSKRSANVTFDVPDSADTSLAPEFESYMLRSNISDPIPEAWKDERQSVQSIADRFDI